MTRPRRLLGWALLTLVSSGAFAHSQDAPTDSRGVGDRVPDFTLKNALTGEDVSLHAFRGKKAGVLVFSGTACPVGDLYMPRLVDLARRYEPRGVVFLMINSNASEPAQQVAEHARRFGVTFPVLKDDGRRVADALQARRTCEALVLDEHAVLRYRGAIDDQYGLGLRREKAEHRFVAEALDALLAGKNIETTATSVVGCPIEGSPVETLAGKVSKLERVRAPSDEQARLRDADEGDLPDVGSVTYSGEVAAILQDRCQNCHRPGQVAPFSLLTYKDAKRWATAIHEVVDARRMPPWHADPRYGHFANDRRLTARQRATLLAWVEQGAPEGDPAAAPPPRSFPEGWTVGTPDLVIEMPEEFIVKPEGFLNYQRFRVPLNLDKDIWVQAAEARPGDRAVVHHIIAYVIDPARPNDRPIHLCGYAPGDMPSVYPPGTAKRIAAGSVLVFELHYTPIGQVRIDRSAIGLVLAKGPVEREAVTMPIANERFVIPPNAPAHEVTAKHTFRDEVTLLAFMPHMHLRGKDFSYTVAYPDGRVEKLLSVPAYDFGWQSYYTLKQPLKLPAGSRIECVAHFDNSQGNPANPAPDQEVRWGDQTYEEMMIGYVDVVFDHADGTTPRASARRAGGVRRLLRAVGRRGEAAIRPAPAAAAGAQP